MSPTLRQVATTTTLAAAALLSACAKKDAATTDSTASTSTSSAVTATTTTAATTAQPVESTRPLEPAHYTDGNIVAKLVAADTGEVLIASLAQSMSSNPAVKSYAALLIADHTKGLQAVNLLAQQEAITPRVAVGDTTMIATADELSRLKGLPKGVAFDTAFVNHEIEDHNEDIKDAEAMAGATQNAPLKALLQKMVPELQKHLDKAQRLASAKP